MKDWEILKAVSEGKEVQFMNFADRWTDLDGSIMGSDIKNLRATLSLGKWRITPAEPKVIYVNEYPEQGICNGYFKKSIAEGCTTARAARTAVKYIEAQE